MTPKSLKVLLAATALGVGALAYSGPADAYVRGCGWRHHHRWVYASDYVAPRRIYEPVYTTPVVYTTPLVYTSSYWPWYGYGWPF